MQMLAARFGSQLISHKKAANWIDASEVALRDGATSIVVLFGDWPPSVA
jgi:hypothetical protein